MTAVADGSSPATISPSARATPSRVPKPSRCSAPALVIRPMVGRASATSRATSPGAVGAHLDHREPMRLGEAQQRQRHADVIVEVAARGQALARLPQDRCGHLLGGGLAVAAGDPDQGSRERTRAMQLRRARALPAHPRTTICGRLIGCSALDHGAGRPKAAAAADELVAVEVRALERDEQLARPRACASRSTTSPKPASAPSSRPPQARAKVPACASCARPGAARR